MPLALRLPPLSERSATAPETRPSRVAAWLTEMLTREPGFAARAIGEALAGTNRVSLGHSRRLDLAEQYWQSAALLWPRLERQFTRASHPLQGDNLEAAKASLTLANELSTAYKRLLVREASRRFVWGGPRRTVALVRRAFQATSRVLANSYLAYAPVPPQTWYDAHDIYAYTRERKIHRHPVKLCHCRLRAIRGCDAVAEFAQAPGEDSAIAAVGLDDEDSRAFPLAGNMIEIEAHSHASGAKRKWLTLR